MGAYRLGDADRERLGCPEWLPFNLVDASIDDVTDLAERFGFALDDWPEAYLGEIDMDTVGQEREPDRIRPKWQIKAAVWMALHQNGVNCSWDDVGKVALLRASWRSDPDESPGKDQ